MARPRRDTGGGGRFRGRRGRDKMLRTRRRTPPLPRAAGRSHKTRLSTACAPVGRAPNPGLYRDRCCPQGTPGPEERRLPGPIGRRSSLEPAAAMKSRPATATRVPDGAAIARDRGFGSRRLVDRAHWTPAAPRRRASPAPRSPRSGARFSMTCSAGAQELTLIPPAQASQRAACGPSGSTRRRSAKARHQEQRHQTLPGPLSRAARPRGLSRDRLRHCLGSGNEDLLEPGHPRAAWRANPCKRLSRRRRRRCGRPVGVHVRGGGVQPTCPSGSLAFRWRLSDCEKTRRAEVVDRCARRRSRRLRDPELVLLGPRGVYRRSSLTSESCSPKGRVAPNAIDSPPAPAPCSSYAPAIRLGSRSCAHSSGLRERRLGSRPARRSRTARFELAPTRRPSLTPAQAGQKKQRPSPTAAHISSH